MNNGRKYKGTEGRRRKGVTHSTREEWREKARQIFKIGGKLLKRKDETRRNEGGSNVEE